ncbi:MAG: hypothetical protein EXS69_00085 [Candidatus Zambryskibacteria bacterium]|nr:hypothetical protein [Candidatus Zambryskibacteria bacterium]
MKKVILATLTFAPALASAGPQNFSELIYEYLLPIIDVTLPVLVLLALLVFFKGLVGFIAKSGDVKSHDAGKSFMIWGLVALFVMVSVFGILKFFSNDLGFRNPNNQGGILPLLPVR